MLQDTSAWHEEPASPCNDHSGALIVAGQQHKSPYFASNADLLPDPQVRPYTEKYFKSIELKGCRSSRGKMGLGIHAPRSMPLRIEPSGKYESIAFVGFAHLMASGEWRGGESMSGDRVSYLI